jgi:hypothetical protein
MILPEAMPGPIDRSARPLQVSADIGSEGGVFSAGGAFAATREAATPSRQTAARVFFNVGSFERIGDGKNTILRGSGSGHFCGPRIAGNSETIPG